MYGTKPKKAATKQKKPANPRKKTVARPAARPQRKY